MRLKEIAWIVGQTWNGGHIEHLPGVVAVYLPKHTTVTLDQLVALTEQAETTNIAIRAFEDEICIRLTWGQP